MSILVGKQVLRPFIRKASGYVKSLLSSEHVEMNSGSTLQETMNEITNNLHTHETLINGKFDTESTTGRFSMMRCSSSTMGAGSQIYGRTICFDFGVGSADKYYLTVASNGGLYVGLQLNGASTITWIEK